MKKNLCLLSLPLLFAAASATAEVTCGGYLSRNADGGAQASLGDKVSVIVFHNVTQVNTDKGGRYDGPAGDCGGTVTVLPNDTVQVAGACTVMDGDGDVAIYQFQHLPGDQRGTFKRAGGTGKFVDDFRSGWYQQTAQQDNGASGIWGGDDEAVCE